MDNTLIQKYEVLKRELGTKRRLAVAFSGGVDSTFLLYAASEALGDKVIAITARSPMFPKAESDETVEFCKNHGIRQIVFEADELSIEGFSDNPPNRCYLCKKRLFSDMLKIAEDEGMFLLSEGTNLDDEGDYRPGLMALKELNIYSPLRQLAFTKKEIRALSKVLGLTTWEKPSYACLASRIPYGETIDKTKLNLIEKAERYLMDQGFKEVRVRIYGTVNARIELNPNDFSRFMRADVRLTVNEVFRSMGFAYVSLDLIGYRSGSMNEVLS